MVTKSKPKSSRASSGSKIMLYKLAGSKTKNSKPIRVNPKDVTVMIQKRPGQTTQRYLAKYEDKDLKIFRYITHEKYEKLKKSGAKVGGVTTTKKKSEGRCTVGKELVRYMGSDGKMKRRCLKKCPASKTRRGKKCVSEKRARKSSSHKSASHKSAPKRRVVKRKTSSRRKTSSKK
jgi:hypothetical protein